MKKKLVLGLVLTSFASIPLNVNAKGVAKVDFTGKDTVNVGDTFKVYMNVYDIQNTYNEEGVVSFGGKLTFDENKVEYVSAKNLDTPYAFQINPKTMMLAGLDFTLKNGIQNYLSIYEFTFKAKEEGETSITLDDPRLTDTKDYLSTTVNEKTVEIVKPVEVVKETIKPKVVKKEVNKIKLQNMIKHVNGLFKKLTNLIK